MAKGPSGRVRVAALILAFVGAVLAATPAHAQYVEPPADALARNIKLLATSPKNFNALIAAGRAAVALGDTQSAAGFFGRAEEVWPGSPLPQAGMGAALAHDGDARGALLFFARATQRGATVSMIGADRGLAYDLLGQHAQAQSDYRAALVGRDTDEARRRLAMSLAISGKKDEALSTLGPLMARGDPGAARSRAFVLALSGDPAGAKAALDSRMPGSSGMMAYFFTRLPSLRSDQKAAAVNLGIFPGAGTQYASAAAAPPVAPQPEQDRIGSIQQWLSQTPSQPVARAAPSVTLPPQPRPTQVASVSYPPRLTTQTASRPDAAPSAAKSRRYWLQLASGTNAAALPQQFRRLKSRGRELFDGISGYVAEDAGRARLVIGPFRNPSEAEIFAEDLGSVSIDAFQWVSEPGQSVRKLPAE